MPKEKVPFNALAQYLPPNTVEAVVHYIQLYQIQFTVTLDRKSILGDYRPPHQGKGHRITVNGSLNPYSFLITFIHEVAHLQTHIQYNHSRVEPHGKEWQHTYALLLEKFVQMNVFPSDLVVAIRKSQVNPAASSCAEIHLTKALHKYDANPHQLVFVEQIQEGQQFITKDGRVFEKGAKRRTRHLAKEITTSKLYLFSGIYKVKAKD
jgi:SprT protein